MLVIKISVNREVAIQKWDIMTFHVDAKQKCDSTVQGVKLLGCF